jgi:2-isopropylmalate synthase
MAKEKIIIFDTTLRDGEQAAGTRLGAREKVEIARQLARLKVDVIEAGFPASSPEDFEAVRLISEQIQGPTICGLTRAIEKDIETCQKALAKAKRFRIHTGIGVSEIHIAGKFADDKYGKTIGEKQATILKMAVEAVRHTAKYTDDIEFYAEDSGRADRAFLYEILEAVIDAGATTVNIPDTTGYSIPEQYGALIRDIRANVPNIEKAVISVHCHDDLGMAVANSLAGVKNGARQIEGTINGVGERAGNAAIEEAVMAIHTRRDFFEEVETDINTREFYRTSHMVADMLGMPVPANKAIVGSNAFAHSSGIHVDGFLKKRETLSKEEMEKTYEHFLAVADKKKEVFDEDLAAIISDEIHLIEQIYELLHLHVVIDTDTAPKASVKMRSADKTIQADATGDGPVDAAYEAIREATGQSPKLESYSIRAVTGGKEALGEATVRIIENGRTFIGRGISTDIIEASALAYVDAINRMVSAQEKGEQLKENPEV